MWERKRGYRDGGERLQVGPERRPRRDPGPSRRRSRMGSTYANVATLNSLANDTSQARPNKPTPSLLYCMRIMENYSSKAFVIEVGAVHGSRSG